MAAAEAIQKIYDRFEEYCAEYMGGEDADSVGVTVIVHPMYRLTAVASKGLSPQKDRLGSVMSLFSQDYYTAVRIKDIKDASGCGFTGIAVMKEKGGGGTAERFLRAVSTFHRPDEELLRTVDESFAVAKLMEYEVLQNGEIRIPDTLPQTCTDVADRLPEAVLKLNKWLEVLLSGGSSTASVRRADRGLVISPFPESAADFAREFITVLKDTQELWLKRPRRENEFLAQLKNAMSEEKIEILEEAEESSKVLEMGRRESESYFRTKKEKGGGTDFDPLDMLEMTPEHDGRNDPMNNRFGMDPFRRMNVNEIFFHSTVL